MQPFRIEGAELRAIIPSDEEGNLLSDVASREISNTWSILSDHYEENAAIGSRNPKTLIDVIQYNNKWATQFPLKTSVIYNTSGQILRAAVGKYAIDSNLYRIPLSSIEECHYLCAMLNAKPLSLLFTLSRGSDRHFHKNPLNKVPIPRFNSRNAKHVELATISMKLHDCDKEELGHLKKLEDLAREVFLLRNGRRYEPLISH